MSNSRPLIELKPRWQIIDGVNEGRPVAIVFDCPIDGPDHQIFVPFAPNVWNPPRVNIWQKSGDDFASLTLLPSIFYDKSPCRFHGFVTSGMVTW